nr:CoA-transferase [Streptomyces sp. WAC 06738]
MRDNAYYRDWEALSRDRARFAAWQLDRHANINTTAIRTAPGRPDLRLAGAGGAPEIAAHCGEVFIVLRHTRRSLVRTVDFVTTVGHGTGPGSRARLGLTGRGPTAVITDLGILRPSPDTRELTLTDLHPGVTPARVRAATGWDLRAVPSPRTTPEPTPEELAALRALKSAGAA